MTSPACCVQGLNEIANQVPKFLADVGQYVAIELGNGMGQVAIRVVAVIAVRAFKLLHPG